MFQEFLAEGDIIEVRNLAICLCDSGLYECISLAF